MARRLHLNFQTIVYLLFAAAFGYAVIVYRGELVEVYHVLLTGIWYFVLATLLVLAASIYNQARLYSSIYRLFALPTDDREMVPLYLVRRFISVAAPSSGFAGWVPFFQLARKRRIGVGAVFAANLVYTILWYSTFFVFMFVGLLTLFFANDLRWYEISAALVMFVTDVGMIAGLVLAWLAPNALERVMAWLGGAFEAIFRRLGREAPLKTHQFTRVAQDLSGAIVSMRTADRRQLLTPVVHAFLNETLHILMFYLIALAFGVHLHFGVLVAAYSTSILFYVVSPTPGGIGVVEGMLIVAMTALGVRAGSATVIALAYRGITFWLPFLLGFGALRWFNQSALKERPLERPGDLKQVVNK